MKKYLLYGAGAIVLFGVSAGASFWMKGSGKDSNDRATATGYRLGYTPKEGDGKALRPTDSATRQRDKPLAEREEAVRQSEKKLELLRQDLREERKEWEKLRRQVEELADAGKTPATPSIPTPPTPPTQDLTGGRPSVMVPTPPTLELTGARQPAIIPPTPPVPTPPMNPPSYR